jgi:DNA-binding response OmpR family regulator
MSGWNGLKPITSRIVSDAAQGTPGRSILVVEDEVLICLLIETILMDAEYQVIIANSVADALNIVDAAPLGAAILDLNVKGEKVFPVAEKLAAASIPFIFATGGGGAEIVGFPNAPWIAKPFRENELLEAIDRLTAGSSA